MYVFKIDVKTSVDNPHDFKLPDGSTHTSDHGTVHVVADSLAKVGEWIGESAKQITVVGKCKLL